MKQVSQSSDLESGATIYQVAKQAGVSIATVSRMINGSGYVGAYSRERIKVAMDALRFEPSGVARSLTTKHSELIALLLIDIANPFCAQVARGVQDVAQAAGYLPIICSADNAAVEINAVRTLRHRRVDGVIVTPSRGERSAENERVLHELCDCGMAMVCIDCRPIHPQADEVNTDTFGGVRLAVAHLAALGHRRIAFIGGRFNRGIAMEQLGGYRQGLEDAGLPAPVHLVREGDLDEASGQRETRALLTLLQPPTAIFCVNDCTALGAMAALNAQSLLAPHDISIVGFDDIPLASQVIPALTTVRQPAHELGHVAATFLLERIAHPDAPHQRTVLPCELVVRQSSASPSAVS